MPLRCTPSLILGSYLLNNTANPAHFHQTWAKLAVLFSRQILNGLLEFKILDRKIYTIEALNFFLLIYASQEHSEINLNPTMAFFEDRDGKNCCCIGQIGCSILMVCISISNLSRTICMLLPAIDVK